MKLLRFAIGMAIVAASLQACADDPAVAGTAPLAAHPMPGYTLVAPIGDTSTYLIDLEGRVVHVWTSAYKPGAAAYLKENGHLIRSGALAAGENTTFFAGGTGGVVEEFDWDGKRVWFYEYHSPTKLLHHDIEVLPNDNVLMMAWELKSREEAIAAGRGAGLVTEKGLWVDHLIEVKPTLPEGGEIVWSWHVWDHLVQDQDVSKPNYGDALARPERVSLNPPNWATGLSDADREALENIGYLGGEAASEVSASPSVQASADWTHINSVDYHSELDQITLSALGFNEVWILDHSTTTDEARGSTGGRWGKGGDLLYRFGNPSAYGRLDGEPVLVAQHDAQWILPGRPGEGQMLLFNNGRAGKEGNRSSVDVFDLPQSEPGRYRLDPAGGYEPARRSWQYTGPENGNFYSLVMSGAQRLPTGTTLICLTVSGHLLEVALSGETVWEYYLPSPLARPGAASKGVPGAGAFRALRYAPDYPAFSGRSLTPGGTLADAVGALGTR